MLFCYHFEFKSLGYKKMAYATVVIAFFEWLMLVITRAHWIIDFTTAIAYAFVLHRIGEYLTYLTEVKGFGYPKLTRRSFYFSPCAKCGSATSKTDHLLSEGELKLQH